MPQESWRVPSFYQSAEVKRRQLRTGLEITGFAAAHAAFQRSRERALQTDPTVHQPEVPPSQGQLRGFSLRPLPLDAIPPKDLYTATRRDQEVTEQAPLSDSGEEKAQP